MCDDCMWRAYRDVETLEGALEEIADLHTGDWTPTRFMEGAACCKGCDEWWPCVTFLTAVGAINDAR